MTLTEAAQARLSSQRVECPGCGCTTKLKHVGHRYRERSGLTIVDCTHVEGCGSSWRRIIVAE